LQRHRNRDSVQGSTTQQSLGPNQKAARQNKKIDGPGAEYLSAGIGNADSCAISRANLARADALRFCFCF
jgi:hypothetical protein